jgi:hypothetical protein
MNKKLTKVFSCGSKFRYKDVMDSLLNWSKFRETTTLPGLDSTYPVFFSCDFILTTIFYSLNPFQVGLIFHTNPLAS